MASLHGTHCIYLLRLSLIALFELLKFLKLIFQHGILNIEMEANLFLSYCLRAGVKGAVICISIVNRLNGDQIETPKDVLKMFENRPLQIIVQMIKNRMEDALSAKAN